MLADVFVYAGGPTPSDTVPAPNRVLCELLAVNSKEWWPPCCCYVPNPFSFALVAFGRRDECCHPPPPTDYLASFPIIKQTRTSSIKDLKAKGKV